MRKQDTIKLLDLWESLYNLNFKPIEFNELRNHMGLNVFTMLPI